MSDFLRILLVEDDDYFRADIAHKLAKYGEISAVRDAREAKHLLGTQSFEVAIIDLNLETEYAGLEVIRDAVARKITPIVLTGNDDPRIVARAYELGCQHYLGKLEVQADLDRQLGFYLRSVSSAEISARVEKEFITRDPHLVRILSQLLGQNLNRDQRYLILGPTGVGKTKLAKLIHQLSEPSLETFVHLNIAEVPDTLVESVLFGHRKGAFTGATEDRDGLFKKADGGTLFLDEIGSISVHLQKKLLKALEEKSWTPVGASTPVRSDFRLITATCEDLPKLIETRRFRLDLYFRLKGTELNLPPLRDRRIDIPELIQFFSRRCARRISFSESALDALRAYDWPGNVRELEQLVKSFASSSLGVVQYGDLPVYVQENRSPYRGDSEARPYNRNISGYIQKHGLRKFIESIERDAFADLYRRNSGNLSRTQQALGISKSAAYRIFAAIQADSRSVSG